MKAQQITTSIWVGEIPESGSLSVLHGIVTAVVMLFNPDNLDTPIERSRIPEYDWVDVEQLTSVHTRQEMAAAMARAVDVIHQMVARRQTVLVGWYNEEACSSAVISCYLRHMAGMTEDEAFSYLEKRGIRQWGFTDQEDEAVAILERAGI